MEGKVFYVWFDAPIEYIACAQEWVDAGKGDDWERWWRTDKGADDVRYTQFMGKDNVPFHTLSFPATIMGSGEPWKLVDYIKSFNYLNYDGGQFSTSRGRGVFMDQALEILPADYWRWWLLSPRARNVGCRVHMGKLPSLGEQGSGRCAGQFRQPHHQVLPLQIRRSRARSRRLRPRRARADRRPHHPRRALRAQMDAMEVRKSAAELRGIWVRGNEYLQSAAPWTAFKTDPDKAAMQVRLAPEPRSAFTASCRALHPDAAARSCLRR